MYIQLLHALYVHECDSIHVSMYVLHVVEIVRHACNVRRHLTHLRVVLQR